MQSLDTGKRSSPVDITVAIERITRIPDRYRQFTVPMDRAARFYRIFGQLLDELLALGLPHRGGNASLTFDKNDLKSLVLNLRLRSPHRAAFEGMARGLNSEQAVAAGEREMTVQPFCPDPGHPGECDFSLTPPIRESPSLTRVRSTGPRLLEVGFRSWTGGARYFDFTDGQRELAGEVLRLEFHPLPFALGGDLGFLADSGLADCRLATQFQVALGRRLDVPVRGVTGLLLGKPVASRHSWIELRVGEQWSPADPFLLTALVRLGFLDEAAWPPNRSPAGAFWKLPMRDDEVLLTDRAARTAGKSGLPLRLGPAYFFVH